MIRSLIFLVFSAISTSSAHEWQKELSSPQAGHHPSIGSTELEFSLSWKGMLKAGILNIQFAPRGIKKPGSFVIKSSASSRGAAAALFPYHHNYWSELHPINLQSKFFHATESNSDEAVTTTNRYSSSKVVINERTVDSETSKITIEKKTFPFGPARDMFSAMLYIRSLKLDVGDEHVMLLLPFKSPYLLKVRVEAREKHMAKDCIRLSVSMRKIDRDTHALVPYKKLKKPATLWLSDDKDRLPLELRAAVYIGDIRAVLTGHSKTP